MDVEPDIAITNHKEQIYHGLVNLVKNSMEAISDAGKVEISLERTENGSRITVNDSGCGLDKEELASVLSAGFTTKPTGHGLGLHSFSVFLSSHSGLLRITSPGKGMGCRISIEINHA
jgi:signal transduction histidine kinase